MAGIQKAHAPPETPFVAIYFDCDSTLSRIEGVDEMTSGLPAAQRGALADLTDKAMDGQIPLGEVYGHRLQVLGPTPAMLQQVGARYVEEVVPGAAEVVALLQRLGKVVGIVSGGLRTAVLTLAHHLGIEAGHVHAVELHFHQGRYQDFDRSTNLWRNGGKPEFFAALPMSSRPVAFVGDGVTDLEALPMVDRFIGYGGVICRPKVQQGAPFFSSETDLRSLLPLLLTQKELASAGLPPHTHHER